MSPSKEPGKKIVPPTPTRQKEHYTLLPKLHPNKWKLIVLDYAGQEIFHLTRLPTNPMRYRGQAIQPANVHPITIKTTKIGAIAYYSLFAANEELFSIRYPVSSPIVTLWGKNRKVIAHFKPISSDLIFLQTDSTRIARIHFKEKPSPLGLVIESQVDSENHWLYAIILYAIACIESRYPEPLSENASLSPISENTKTATP